jgi:hypothetical protein
VKIKIIFIDQLKDDKVLVEMRKFFSPIISEIAGTKMGLFHSALMIGFIFIFKKSKVHGY